MDYLSHNVSENLKKIRKAKGMSLEFETDEYMCIGTREQKRYVVCASSWIIRE